MDDLHKWPDCWSAVQHRLPAGRAHHRAVQVVRVVLGISARMDQVGVDGLLTQVASRIVDGVWRIQQVPVGQAQHRSRLAPGQVLRRERRAHQRP